MALSILLSALRAVGKSCVAALAGVLAIRAGLVGAEAVEDISRLTGKLLLPCFLLSSLSAQVTASKLAAMWVLPLFAVGNLALGLALGKALSAMLGQRGDKSRSIIMACCTFGNTAALPLALIEPILSSHPSFYGGQSVEAAQRLSITYVSVFSIFNKVGIWTIGRALIEETPSPSAPVLCRTMMKKPHSLAKTMMKEPATMSCALGLLIALGPVKAWFYGGEAPLGFLMEGVDFLGDATLPMLMVVLGASLAKGPDASGVGVEVVAAVAAGRLLVMPCLGSVAVFLAFRRCPSAFDPVMLLVLLLQTCMPSAESLALLAQMRGGQVAKDMSALLFYQYLVSPLTISIAASLALAFISHQNF